MKYGQAIEILENFDDGEWTEDDVMKAIDKMLSMTTINAVRKDFLIKALRFVRQRVHWEVSQMEEREYNNIDREELEAVLTKAGVFKGWNEPPEHDISRIAHCEALGQKFDIEWWINQCYLKIGHMQMMFHWVRVDTTWPWYQYRTELHFENSVKRYFEPCDTVAVLGIEYHKDYLEKHPELKEEAQ